MRSAHLITDNESRGYERIEYTLYEEYWVEKIYSDSTLLSFFSTSFAAQNSVSNRKVAAFTGKERDEETGLYYYGARYMDPRTSRWLSTDPALGEYMAGSNVGQGGIYNQVNFNLYHYAGNNPIKYTDPTGMWINNGDGTFTAEKDDTLWGLQQETGKDWHESNWENERDSRTLQVGETVDMGKRSLKPENVPTVSNTKEATDLYYQGDGKAAWLADSILDAVKTGDMTTKKIDERIKTGETNLSEGDWGENLTYKKNMFFVGDTTVDYKIYSGTKTTIVDFTAFARDGFWDILPGSGDGVGSKKELPGGHPYPFIGRSWSISFPNPSRMNWR